MFRVRFNQRSGCLTECPSSEDYSDGLALRIPTEDIICRRKIPKITDFPYPVGNATKTSFPFMKVSTASRCFVFRGWTFSETAAASIKSSMYAERFTVTSQSGYYFSYHIWWSISSWLSAGSPIFHTAFRDSYI